MPEPNRSPAEIAFVLRNAKRRRGPEVLRDLARAEEAQADAAAHPPRGRAEGQLREGSAPRPKRWL